MPAPTDESPDTRFVLPYLWLGAAAALLGAASDVIQAGPVPAADAEVLFVREVLPLFEAKCFACHGQDPDDLRGGFDMLSRDGLLRGGESGEPALVPGQPDDSLLYRAVRWDDLEMPPKENDRLSEEQVSFIHDWIAADAPWPDEETVARIRRQAWDTADGVTVATSGGLSDEWTSRRYDPENLWAYQPLSTDAAGGLERDDRHPVDALLDRRLQELGIEPAPAADRATLIRRVTFDLTGLPPAPDDVRAFLNDPADDARAFDAVVERLLASPHYGEQWGRHWLDVTRYADSSGFANDYERGNAWRYRDYVVRAFNDDKPYDQFVREQLAGDELDPHDPEMLVAVGFLRMGPWELTGMEVAKVARQRFLDDVTDAVGQVFLGHMLQCARCHDHKFDPVPTRDYYAMQAVFATTQLAEREAAFLAAETTEGFEERRYLEQRREFYAECLRELEAKQTLAAARQWYAENGIDPMEFESVVVDLGASRGEESVTIDAVRQALARKEVDPATIFPRHVGFEPQDFGLERIARKGLERLRWRMERYEPFALSVYSGPTPNLKNVAAPLRMPQGPDPAGDIEQTCILTGGDPFSPGEPVAPAALSAGGLPDADLPTDVSGRRLALAEWIASPDNPLAARVMVNRIWQWHFGRPLAGTPNNFGATGNKPTHPELLDYLAGRFIAEGWSIKQLHRLILSSAAYRRASHHPQPETLAELDPLGTSYASFRPRRLDAEELRDAMLAASGELNPRVGGIPIRPEMNLEAALQPRQVMGTFAEAWQPSPLPEQRHRRSLYALRLRGQTDPFLEVFNAPSPDLSCEARSASTVTPQVFALFNSEITFDRALALARRVQSEGHGGAAAIDRLFQLAYGRPPGENEFQMCIDHWRRMVERHEHSNFDPPEYPTEVLRSAVEENTGERFTFVEPLEVYADFVPDLKAADADPELRGLAEVCLVLLNSNEFVYVY